MALDLKQTFAVGKQSYEDWSKHQASRLAASLAFYTALSLAPLLMIVVGVLGLVFGSDAARGEIVTQFGGLLGTQGAATVESVLASSHGTSGGVLSTIIGTVLLLLSASGVFGELQLALDTIWDVKPREGRGILGMLKDRFFSFTMVMGVAFLLLVSLVITAALSALGSYFGGSSHSSVLWQIVNQVVALAVTSGVFALIFKVVPDVHVPWRDVWVGAVLTSILFTVGKYLIGLYLGRSTTASAYGAAGSLVAVLVWVYYSAQILFFGAELTRTVAKRRGAHIVPSSKAEPADPAGTPATGHA